MTMSNASYKKDKGMQGHKGQSTVEYILLVTAVTAVVIMFTTAKGTGTFQNGLNQVYNDTTQDMLNVASRLQDNAATPS
jgi:Flp pilus assembly pilin Flp